MTDKKQKSAGYFDSIRNCPVYEGDVYFDEGLFEPYFRVVNTVEKGFVVHHVGSTETFALSSEGALLIQRQYIGNELENPNVIAEHKASLEEPKEPASEEVATVEETEQQTAEEVTETENTTQSEVQATEEKVAEIAETATTVEEHIAAVEQANDELKESNAQLKEAVETMFDTPSTEKESENEQICSTDSDVTTTENAENTNELQDNGTGTDNAANSEEKPATETSDKPIERTVSAEATTGKNVIVEVAKDAVPEIIANTKDEKNAVLRKKFITKLICTNQDKIAELEEVAAKHTELAQTLDYKPFIKLKDLVAEALHTNVDNENLKGIKERTKDFESIVNIQGLLKQHQQKAEEAEYKICDLKNEISKFEDELADLEAKIDTFARQQKLALDNTTK